MTDTTPATPGDEPGLDSPAPSSEEVADEATPAPEEPTSEGPDEAVEPDEPAEAESVAEQAEAEEPEPQTQQAEQAAAEATAAEATEEVAGDTASATAEPEVQERSETEAILGASTVTKRDDSADIAAIFGARTTSGDGETATEDEQAEAAEAAVSEEAEAEEAPSPEGEGEAAEVLDEDEVLAESVRARRDSPYDRPGKWYVIHSYAGYEKKVQSNLGSRIQSMNMEGKIFEVVIPTENVTEFKGGKRVTVPKKVFPGYLLCRCFLDDDSWYVIRNTPGVTGFVGTGGKPTPLTRKDVENFLQVPTEGEEAPKRTKPRLEYEQGETVRVREGPFADFSGEIVEINEERLTVKVLVNIFGRETPVELEFSQVAKL